MPSAQVKPSTLDLAAIRASITQPSAIAFSGGGDSTALLHMMRDHPHIDHAMIVDHGLRAGSADEAEQAAQAAREMGYEVHLLHWAHLENDKPETGIQAKARRYRYGAMGTLCRELGQSGLVTGHTHDDQLETVLMRQAKVSGWRGLAGMAAQSYAPLWPELAGVSLYRPLLGVSRAALRDYNRAYSLNWVDDPSNENQDFARIRARGDLALKADMAVKLDEVQRQNQARLRDENALLGVWLARHAKLSPHGFLSLSMPPPPLPLPLLSKILRSVSGTGGPIQRAQLEDLTARLSAPDFRAATLAGAWVVREGDNLIFTRDRRAVFGRSAGSKNMEKIKLSPSQPILWDGRFFLSTDKDDIHVTPVQGHLSRLRGLPLMRALFELPRCVRATLPLYWQGEQPIGFGAFGGAGSVSVQSCAAQRLHKQYGLA